MVLSDQRPENRRRLAKRPDLPPTAASRGRHLKAKPSPSLSSLTKGDSSLKWLSHKKIFQILIVHPQLTGLDRPISPNPPPFTSLWYTVFQVHYIITWTKLRWYNKLSPIFILKITLRVKQTPIRKLAPIFLFEFFLFHDFSRTQKFYCLYNSLSYATHRNTPVCIPKL